MNNQPINRQELFWQAVENKDAKFNGAFYFGVSSTHIYCKPSCSSRLPKRENVSFFTTYKEAETAGFRACLRCQPKSETFKNQNIETVLNICEFIEANNFENVSLEDLSAELKLSSAHLQKVFKEVVGVSPKQYADANRLQRFKAQIKKGENVTNAMYDAGFGSSRALYEKAARDLGMTPSAYRKGGKDMKINYTITNSRLGNLLVAATEKGICAVTFGDDERQLEKNLSAEYPNAEISREDITLKNYVEAILQNLEGRKKALELPLDLQATAFQLSVWAELKKIPFGETRSYKQIAENLGDAKAVRAVASACGKNRTALVIPCHRVIGSDGSLSGYRWGIERKEELLKQEKSLRKNKVGKNKIGENDYEL